LTVREEHKLRVFENRVLRRIFGPKRVEVMGEWGKLHNEELCDLYCSPSIIRIIKLRMRLARHVARMGRRGTHIGYWWESQKNKAIPVTGRGGLKGCEMLRIPHCLDSRLTYGVKVVSPTHKPRSTLQKFYFSASGTHVR
jgi:hypothetical protein